MGIIAFLQVLPQLINLLSRIADLGTRVLNWAEKNQLDHKIDKLEEHIDNLEKAHDSKTQLEALDGLLSSIRKL